MTVKNLGPEEHAGDGQGGAGKYREANVVVRIIHTRFAIDTLTVEERRAIHQVKREFGGRLIEHHIVPRQSQIDGDTVVDAARAFEIDRAVTGNDDRHLVAGLAQCHGERANHVG